MSNNTMFTLSPSQVEAEIIKCIGVGLVPYITSSPGMGKSSIVAKVAKDYRLKMIDLRLPQCTPEDLQGFPMRTGNKATFTPFDIFPLEGEEIPEGYDGWVLFLDELSSASKPVQAASYKLILDRMVGSFKLHDRCVIVAAGNKDSDKAVTVKMSTALQSRLVHYEMELTLRDWMDNFAIPNKIDHRITGFLNYMPSNLMDFRPDHQDKTFACPRTWEFLSRLIQGEEIVPSMSARIAGTISTGMAVTFMTFAEEYNRLPKITDILADPKNIPIPTEASTKYATLSMLFEHHTEQNLDDLITYVNRYPIELQIVFVRGLVIRSPKLRSSHKGLGKYLIDMVRFM